MKRIIFVVTKIFSLSGLQLPTHSIFKNRKKEIKKEKKERKRGEGREKKKKERKGKTRQGSGYVFVVVFL